MHRVGVAEEEVVVVEVVVVPVAVQYSVVSQVVDMLVVVVPRA